MAVVVQIGIRYPAISMFSLNFLLGLLVFVASGPFACCFQSRVFLQLLFRESGIFTDD